MGRSKDENRTRVVPVRMNQAEYEDASACAEAMGISLSRLMRSRAEALPPLRAAVDLRVAGELARIGSNINQVARAVHSGAAPRVDRLEPLLKELHELLLQVSTELRK